MILRHDLPDSAGLVDEGEWPSVITFFDGDGAGTLIAERWVLTAAHTARNIPENHRFSIVGREVGIEEVVIHPATSRPIDLALVKLDTTFGAAALLSVYESDDELGCEVVLLGRGDFGNGREGALGTDRRLRRATNRIDSVDEVWLRFTFDPPPDCTEYEGVCGEGDSGGPALIRADGGLRVVGVSSWQEHDGPPGRYGCVEHYARVSTQLDWIRIVLGS